MKKKEKLTESGLSLGALHKYARNPLLERDENDGTPIYMHRANCPSFCDYACNGAKGSQIARDVAKLKESTHA